MYQALSLAEWEALVDSFDRDVLRTNDIAAFCSSSDWLLAAHHTLHDSREPVIRRSDRAWLGLCCGPLSSFERVLQPLEFAWGFGCPMIGASFDDSCALLLQALDELRGTWQLTLLSGIPVSSPWWAPLMDRIARHYYVETFEGTHCMQADLSGGSDAFLAKRTSKFRNNLRRAEKQANAAGITFEWCRDDLSADALYQRIWEIEQRSWKFQQESSIFSMPRYVEFYTMLMERLAKKGTLRVLFARQGDKDVAYVFGGIIGQVYRGFQLSYDQELSSLSLGHLVQWEMIKRLAEEGIENYDLGMAMDYKRRWSDHELKLTNLAIFPL